MKKIFIIAVLASALAGANAQDLMSKRGTPILPEAGDWSIGIDAVPFIDWAFDKTRVFSNTTVSSANNAVSSQVPMTLVGLYVKDATTAYRGRVRIGIGSTTTDNTVASDVTANTFVTDEFKHSYSNITLGAGIQKSRGKGRLHGIYGAELAIMLGSSDNTFSYGNAYTSTNQKPTSTDFTAAPVNSVYPSAPASDRVTEVKNGSTFGVGLDGFIGVEYFFAPKMSLSAEYNWGLFFSSTGDGTTTVEAANGTTSTSTSASFPAKNSSFMLDVNNINSVGTGNIVFHFYF